MDNVKVLLVKAEKSPHAGTENLPPNKLYLHPSLSVTQRQLGPLQDGYIRVEMLYAGICGTDIQVIQTNPETGHSMGSAPLVINEAGRVLGHEGVGRIVLAGAGVNHVGPGRYVTFESIITCRVCEACRRGNYNQCEHASLLGMEQDGLFGTTVDVPAWLAHDVSDLAESDKGVMAAACIEPAACAHVAAAIARICPGDRVVIFGGGPIGYFAAMQCRDLFGASKIHLVEPVEFRRNFAQGWADHVYDVEEFYAAQLQHRLDVVIETSGITRNIDRVFRRMGPNSRIVLLARSGQPLPIHDVDHMITNNVSISGSRGHLGGAFDDLLRLYRAGRLPLHDAVTSTIDGLESLRRSLEQPSVILESNCKVLCDITATG